MIAPTRSNNHGKRLKLEAFMEKRQQDFTTECQLKIEKDRKAHRQAQARYRSRQREQINDR